MPDHGSDLPWTDEQWAIVQTKAQDAARKARIGSSFLPLVGPLPPGQAQVPRLTMTGPGIPAPLVRGETQNWLLVDNVRTTSLITIWCNVYLTSTEAEDPELSAALDMICRAAVLVGRLEDAYVFTGQNGVGGPPNTLVLPPGVVTEQGGDGDPGLINAGGPVVSVLGSPGPAYGDKFVAALVAAIQSLEVNGQYGPFACVLCDPLYLAAYTPTPALPPLRPNKLIMPFLGGGPLLRSNSIPSPPGNLQAPGEPAGVVVSLTSCPVDLVVGTDLHVSYVQRTLEPRYVLRVSERFVLRIKQPDAVCLINT